jgi:hypothetical protein
VQLQLQRLLRGVARRVVLQVLQVLLRRLRLLVRLELTLLQVVRVLLLMLYILLLLRCLLLRCLLHMLRLARHRRCSTRRVARRGLCGHALQRQAGAVRIQGSASRIKRPLGSAAPGHCGAGRARRAFVRAGLRQLLMPLQV